MDFNHFLGGQLFFQFFNNFSINTLYDSFNLTFYNIFWTSLPIFIFGLLEQNLRAKVLLGRPALYRLELSTKFREVSQCTEKTPHLSSLLPVLYNFAKVR